MTIYDTHDCVSIHPEQCRCGDCLTTLAGEVYGPEPGPINYRAVRAFNRAWTPRCNELGMIEDADAGFDGGEFSRPWHADHIGREELHYLTSIGARFGLTAEQLEDMLRDYDWEQNEKLHHALGH